MTLNQHTTDRIEADMCKWIDDLLEKKKSEYTKTNLGGEPVEHVGQNMPFHKALLPKTFGRMSSFERSFSTILGKSYERHSAIIAETRFLKVKLQHKTDGRILESVDAEIVDEVKRVDGGHLFCNYFDVVRRIVDLEKDGSGNKVSRSVISDLYLKSYNDEEYFFEIKTPKPNKEQCLNITRKHLWIHALLKMVQPQVKTYFAMGYNPWGEDNEYKHSFAVKYLDIKRQTIIGKQYWDFLGGDGAFEDLLEIYRKVGSVKSKELNRILET